MRESIRDLLDVEKPKILIVDDKQANLLSLETLLRELPVEIVQAHSGNEALALSLEHEFALMLIDVQMPEMDGFETVELMRQEESTRSIPVIFVSAVYSGDYYKIKGVESGAVDFLEKPLVPELLIGKVSLFLDLYLHRHSLQRLNADLETQIQERTAALLKESEDRKQAEDAARLVQEQAKRAERLEQELRSLISLSSSPTTSVTARMYGVKTLHDGSPETFRKLVEDYATLMDLALEQQAYKVEHDISGRLGAMAEILGFYNAGPRDVIDIHTTALEEQMQKASSLEKRQSYTGEGWVMALELMGNLVAFYRNRVHGSGSPAKIIDRKASNLGGEE